MTTRDNDTITLKDAARHYGFGVHTLRAEADRGRLAIYKIGKRLYTTPADIRDMVEKCRVEARDQDFTLIRSESSGSSETEQASSARAAANETALRLRNSLRNTSVANTNQSRRTRP